MVSLFHRATIKEERNYRMKILWSALLHRATITSPHTNGISVGSVFSAHITADSPYTLQQAAPSSSKLLLRIGSSGRPSNTCFIGTARVYIPNDTFIGLAVFAGFKIVTDRPTDRLTDKSTDHATPSVTICRIYVRSTAMRSKSGSRVYTC